MYSFGLGSTTLQNLLVPKAKETLQKKKQKDCTSQRIWDFGVRMHLRVILEAIHVKSHQQDFPSLSWTRRTPTNTPLCPSGLNPIQMSKAASGDMAHPGKEHNNWLFSTKSSSLETYIQVTLYNTGYIWQYLYIKMYTCNDNCWIKRAWIWRRVGRGVWEGLERGKGRGKYCN